MSTRFLSMLLTLMLAATATAADEMPDPQEILEKMIAAAGGEAFAGLGILELEVTAEEIRNDGTQSGKSFTLIVDTSNLDNLRMELPGEVVVAASKGGGWSTTANVLDDRPQVSKMARLTINQAAFSLLLPFSLQMEGVWLKEVRETQLDGRDVWVITLPFSKGFFVSPVMETTWILVVAKDDYSIHSLEFAPAPAFADVSPVGVRYRILKQKEIDGATIVEQMLATGINSQYRESGANRVTKIASKVQPWDPTLFLSPQQLEALEKDD
jgi:hypothetical protein